MGLTVTPTRWSTCCLKLKTFHKKVMPYSDYLILEKKNMSLFTKLFLSMTKGRCIQPNQKLFRVRPLTSASDEKIPHLRVPKSKIVVVESTVLKTRYVGTLCTEVLV